VYGLSSDTQARPSRAGRGKNLRDRFQFVARRQGALAGEDDDLLSRVEDRCRAFEIRVGGKPPPAPVIARGAGGGILRSSSFIVIVELETLGDFILVALILRTRMAVASPSALFALDGFIGFIPFRGSWSFFFFVDWSHRDLLACAAITSTAEREASESPAESRRFRAERRWFPAARRWFPAARRGFPAGRRWRPESFCDDA
jgi:hypothetical protein